MRFLIKPSPSRVDPTWKYGSDTKKIAAALRADQCEFCAYSERRLDPTTSVDVEHFDPRLKDTPEDSTRNWYAAIHWLNLRKDKRRGNKIEDLQPMAAPDDPTLSKRIVYRNGEFRPSRKQDPAAQNLIDFLLVNEPGLAQERSNQLRWFRETFEFLGEDLPLFRRWLLSKPRKLSFVSAVEEEFEMTFLDLELQL